MEMDISIVNEFSQECHELLEKAEESFLSMDGSENIDQSYNEIFRVFHSLKGSAGMLGMEEMQRHMHLMEDYFSKYKSDMSRLTRQIDSFLEGIDVAREILKGEKTNFRYERLYPGEKTSENKEDVPGKENQRIIAGIYLFVGPSDEFANKIQKICKKFKLGTVECLDSLNELENYLRNNPVNCIILNDDNLLKDISFDIKKKFKIFPTVLCFYNESSKSISKIQVENSENLMHLFDLLPNNTNEEYLLLKLISANKLNQLYHFGAKALNLLMYQFSDLEEYLINKERNETVQTLRKEIEELIFLKNNLSKTK